MKYYPVNIDIKNRKCLVVGGGSVGTRKVKTLLQCKAVVKVVSPRVEEDLLNLAQNKLIELNEREYIPSDLEQIFMVIGATNNEQLNKSVFQDASRRGILCNIADRPELCDFILPSIVHRGDLVISISTSGTSPAFAKKLRKHFEKEFGPEHDLFLKLMSSIRKKVITEHKDQKANKRKFQKLVDSRIIELLKEKNRIEINRLLFEILGPGYSFETLMAGYS